MEEMTTVSESTLVNLQEEYNKTEIQTIIDNLEED